ncbi:MAG TPA: pilin [Candidatus Doudnabacteria bacterium]|nr:pilin [Candidatus Doudnabacteria bacterium]
MKNNWFMLPKPLQILLIIFFTGLLFPNQAIAQWSQSFDCPLSLTISVNPTTVSTWNQNVGIGVALSRADAGYRRYCNTRETVNVTVVRSGGVELGRLTLNMPKSPRDRPSTPVVTGSFAVNLSQSGVTANTTAVGISAFGSGTRNYNTGIEVNRDITLQASAVSITLSGSQTGSSTGTTPGQTPPFNPTEPGSPTPAPPGEGTPLPKVNTDVGITDIKNFDLPLGRMFNALADDVTRPEQIIVRIINILLMLAGILAVIFIMVGGFMLATSAGNENRLTQGKKTLIYAVAGLIVTILSFTIVALVQSVIG